MCLSALYFDEMCLCEHMFMCFRVVNADLQKVVM